MTSANSASFHGMTLVDEKGNKSIDLAAGLVSALGHRHASVTDAISRTRDSHLGTARDRLAMDWHVGLSDAFGEMEHCFLVGSANDANELAFRIARSISGEGRFRVVTLLGSDHGSTFLLRSASGRVDDQGHDGPVAAGFRHVMPNNIAAMSKAIDDSTAAICVAPVDWNRGGEAMDIDYLKAIESLCRERGLLLMIDESRIPPGIGGELFFHQRAEIQADIVTLSAGWFGEMGGGMTLCKSSVLKNRSSEAGESWRWIDHQKNLPYQREIVKSTVKTIQTERLITQLEETVDVWAALLDEVAEGFDFVQSCVHAGLWTTIELDLPASDVAKHAIAQGVRLFVSGENTVLICPPITATAEQLMEAIQSLRQAFESLERETTTS